MALETHGCKRENHLFESSWHCGMVEFIGILLSKSSKIKNHGNRQPTPPPGHIPPSEITGLIPGSGLMKGNQRFSQALILMALWVD